MHIENKVKSFKLISGGETWTLIVIQNSLDN